MKNILRKLAFILLRLANSLVPCSDVFVLVRFSGISLKFKIGDDNSIMAKFTVPDDHEDVPFSLDPITGGEDAEGNSIPAEDFSFDEPTVTDADVVSIVDTPEGGKAFHFGKPGACLAAAQPLYRGEPVGTPITAEFAVTTGQVVSTTGGGFNAPGLTPDPEA